MTIDSELLASAVTEAVIDFLLKNSNLELEDDGPETPSRYGGVWLWEGEGNWGIRKVELLATIKSAIDNTKGIA